MPHDQPVPSADFPVTQWSLVRRAGANKDDRRESLTRLLLLYMPPLLSHLVRRKRIDPHRADDLLQGFIADKVCQQEILARADQACGRFRSYLLTVLDNYVISVIRAEQAAMRSPRGGASLVSQDEAASATTVETSDVFEVAWGRQALLETSRRMRMECEAAGRSDVWGVFEDRVLRPTRGEEPMPYDQLIRRFSLQSPSQASNVLMTAKRTFVRHLHSVFGEYLPEDRIEAEIQDLRKIMANADVE